jgi:hypothetical protein
MLLDLLEFIRMQWNTVPLIIILYVPEFITAWEVYKANSTAGSEGISRLAIPEAKSN